MKKFIISVGGCLIGGVAGSFFTVPSVNSWYPTLVKPPLNPPSWIFAPVWTALYVMMGVAAYLVWRKAPANKGVNMALTAFLIQLALNFAWSPVFFGMRSPLLGLIIIVLMWQTILATIISFRMISKPAAYLLIPYFLWVSFATYLNASIYYLNR